MKADIQRWLIESGEAEGLVAFLREERAPSAPRCASGCVMSSVSPNRTRIDEAVARSRVTFDVWVTGCVVRQMPDPRVHI